MLSGSEASRFSTMISKLKKDFSLSLEMTTTIFVILNKWEDFSKTSSHSIFQ